MKKNGYLRRFLALFLALVMIMADSSVTTFAATVGRVKQKSAAAESSSQCNVQINVAEELDVEQFLNDYKYIMLGTETPDKWPGIGATSSIEKISTTENVVLNDVAEGTEKKIYFVQGKESWQWGAYKTTGDTFQQGENKFKISVSETASGLTVNINKVEFISRNVQIVADADLDFAAFTNQYKYVMLGKTTSSGVEAVSTIEQIDSNTTDVELKVDKDENADDLKLYFIRDTYNLNSNLTNDSKFKQGNVNYKIAVTTDNNNFNVNIEKVVFQPGPTVDYKSVLGNSLHFGIVANDFTCNGDLEANLAVGTLHGSGNMKSSKNYGGNGTTLIGAYVDYGWYIFKNSEGGQGDLILYTTPDAANRFGNDIWSKGLVIDTETYSQEEIQNIVRSMVDESRMTSNKLASDAHTKGLKYSSVADENGVIDLTTSPAGTYYIDFEIGEYANSNLNLKITGDQNIVLNIPDETATLKTYQLNIDGKNCNIGGYANGGIGEKACENIIFNLNNASSVISETIHGVVLVPNGSFENKAVGAGWIVADSVTSGGTEWHCLSRDIPVVTSYAIKAKKTVNGKAPSGNEAGKFTFKLYKIDDKGNETLVDTKSNGDGGLVSFDTFGNITEAGTYWYKITEEGTVAGYTIDTTVYYAEVVVNATPSNGVIISKNAKVTYHKGTKTGDTATVATFNNIKKEDETSANIKVKKTFTNGAADKKFNFVLTPINNAPMPEGAVNGKKTISVAQNDGVKNFGEIKYTTAGTYRYEVVEDSSEQAAGITYDNHRWTVTVAVPADFSTPTVTYSREDGITSTIGAEFTNSEENKETEITLEGTKSLSGRNLKAGEFKFEVKDEVGTVVATGTNDAAGKIAFSRIGYKLSDLKKGDGSYASEKTYSYKVSEVKGNAGDGITYDDKEYTVKVKVSYDQASGTMKAELADKDQKLAFANSYDTETGIDLEGTKSLEGRTLKDGEFTFEVKGKAGKVVATGSNKSDGSISFNNKLNYKLSDLEKADGSYESEKTYEYTVNEVIPEGATAENNYTVNGVTYDSKTVNVKVTVTYNKETGELKAELAKDSEAIAFQNSYETKTSIGLEGTKSLSGRTLKDGEFTFEVKDKAGKVVATGSNKSDGSISFNNKLNYKLSDLEKADGSYESEKTYEYTVNEVIPEGATAENNYTVNGVTYDSKTVNVKVTVTYNKETGELKAELAKDSEAIAFQNSYETKTSIGLEGTKSLSGRTLKDSEFTFEVKDKAGKVVATGSNKSDGSISFNNKLNYKLSDLEKADGSYESEKTYEYTVNEVIPEGATAENNYTVNGVTYDNSIFTVKVIVSYDQATGIMSAAFAEDSQELIFDNTYDAKGSLTLEASKTLKNKALEADAFNFVLKDKNGETIQTVANDADGNVTFSPLNYTLKDVGTHVYTVSEVQRENTEVTYDTTEYTVEVTVADAGNGKLKVSKTIKKGDDTVDAIAFENIYKGVIDISGSKTWNDADNQDGIRPASITVKLFANGTEAASQVVTPDEAGNWNYVFKNLPQYDAKGKITYTVTESAVAGYETSVSGYNITNTHKPETLDITGTKTWNDSNNQDGKRPKSITVNLLANGIITDTKTVTADDNWTYSFTDLPKYANGQEITYTVSELTVPGYTTTIDDNYNITNSYTPGETSASVTKIWDDADNQDGIRPESITVALLANGTPTNKTVTLTAANNWTQTITGLPEKADGEYITYTWTEVNVPEGYSLTGTSKNETVTTLTNTHTPELTSITGTKTWKDADNQDGKRPESITVNLFADGTKLKSQSVSADADGNWSYSFTDLPKYANGQEITYTVTEDAVDGYTTESDGYNFINTHQPETTEITGTKTWNDANNQDGKRPESITVILLANGTEKTRQAVTADEAGNWTYTFKDLPKYANGQEITYTVAEEEVTDYTTTYDGSNITNSYTPGKTSATVTKIWNDAENQDGKRPESITVSLLADGKETRKTVTLSVENNWKQTISDLPEKADGKAIEYTWTEETLPEGYELTDNSKNGTVTTLTNTYAPETTSITVTKTWDDADNQDGKRPESIIVNLLANGEIVASQTVKADEAGNWTYTFKDLPKYANGKEITYTVTEEAVEGYETSVDGFNITNTYTTETTEVKGSKTWNDADNQDGKRPESITVGLLANGEEKDSQTVTADENGNWTYSFEKLPKYEAGKEILYTVTEDAVADYTTEITGYDITNSYAPGKTSVTVTKAWADNDDRGGHRPKEIKVQLKADGENSGEEITLNAENNWTYTWSDLDQKKAGKDIAYTVEETGKAVGYISTVTGNAEEGFIITNTITSVKISKVDITDQKELAGAHIQVIDKDGNVVEEWDSTWEAHEVTGLKPGETYTLRETVAPEGYTLTSDTTFTLKEDGTVNKDITTTTISDNGTLLVEDSRTSVKVSKVDISDGKELEGAHIQIIDQDGNVVDEWDSTKEAHVTEKLKTGKIYTLRETVAPDGYLLTSDTTFVLKEDGTVDAEKTTAVSKDGVLLVQDKLATAASIAVTKKLTYIGENLAARDQTFYVALYSDKDCTQRVSDVKALVFKNADASTVVFSENIKAGKTYYIAECTQDGTSQTIGALADGTVYEAVFGNGNSTTVTEANGTTTVSFENVFSSFPPDGFYKQGQLTITKKVLGADGGTRNSNEVFYAGIFDDAAHTQLSQQVEQNIIKLDMDGGYEVSEIINVGLAQSGAKVTLYVTETDSNGKPIAGSEGFGYKVTVSADSVIFDETNMTAEVVITNQEESTVTETPTPTPSSDGGNSGGSENHSGGYGGGKSPKTGDDTPIGTYLMLLLAAAMLAAETERSRRRNKRQ
ncbi:Cna B-type domain-containing protein [Blautia faecis]|uniref:Cna B-type domain-containing protein n=6 Tax=Clostridia TaxID=186801 RepID=UPI00210A4079|nr:Cna B-type domain-containing protein [Blautia faecis]MCQ4932041.1 Cna B-type domain-containing protein [Blautia faecis]